MRCSACAVTTNMRGIVLLFLFIATVAVETDALTPPREQHSQESPLEEQPLQAGVFQGGTPQQKEGIKTERASKKPNIVLILADDLGHNDVPWHNSALHMPELAALAASGVLLENSYVQPVCTPTRAALLTGRYPHTIGMQAGALEALQPTGLNTSLPLLPETLRGAGYSTHMVGKWHLGFCDWDYTPTRRGFDTFYGFYSSGQNYYTGTTTQKFKFGSVTERISGYDRRRQEEVYEVDRKTYAMEEFGAEAAAVIKRHDPEKPLFLYLPLQAVHGPTQVPGHYTDRYSAVRNKRRRKFMGMLTAMDESVGAVVTALKEAKLYDNTIIIFSSDNGGTPKAGGSNWPLRGYKHTLYEGGVRVPAFVHSPMLPVKPTVSKSLFHVTDWYPTLSRVAGVAVPSGLDGVDQWDHLNSRAEPARTGAILYIKTAKILKAAIRQGDFKLLVGEDTCHSWVNTDAKSSLRRKKQIHQLTQQLNDDDTDDSISGSLEDSNSTNILSRKVNSKCKLYGSSGKRRMSTRALSVADLLNSRRSNIQLYSITDDPEERNDLSSERPDIVLSMLQILVDEVSTEVPADDPPFSRQGHPKYFSGNWAPGWCDANSRTLSVPAISQKS